MKENEENEEDLNWSTQKIKITHLLNESLIEEKQIELSDYILQNDKYLLSKEKSYSKTLNMVNEQISKLRSEVSYLERDLGNIDEKKRNFNLAIKIETSKLTNSIKMDIKRNNQKIEHLKNEIEEQRKKYRIKINEEKNQSENALNEYDQLISNIWDEIKRTEIELYSSFSYRKKIQSTFQQNSSSTFFLQSLDSSLFQSTKNSFDNEEFLEMKSSESLLNFELEDVLESIQGIQRKIDIESSNLDELTNNLREIDAKSSDYQKEMENLNNKHRILLEKLNEADQNSWSQKGFSSVIEQYI